MLSISVLAVSLILVLTSTRAHLGQPDGSTIHVSPSGSHQPPFADWQTASTNVVAAVALARDGDTVLVTNGLYLLSSEVICTAAVRVVSLNGPAFTIVDGMTSNRCFHLKNQGAVVEGFTVRGGKADVGGGVRFGEGGTLRHCIVESNQTTHLGGAGVYLRWDGLVDSCIIRHNQAPLQDGGGIYCLSGGVVSNCVIQSNVARVGGGAVAMFHTTFINCLITGNSATQAGGVMVSQRARLLHCTIADNTARVAGGLQGFYGGEVRNSILRDNHTTDGPDIFLLESDVSRTRFTYCNVSPFQPGLGNLDIDPGWIDAASGNYRLNPASPCVDAGLNQGAPGFDLDGQPRPRDGDADGQPVVDLGAYEFQP